MYGGNITNTTGRLGLRVILVSQTVLGTGDTSVQYGYLDDFAYFPTHTLNSWPSDIVKQMHGREEDRTYDWFRDFEHRSKTPLYLKNPPVLRGIRRIAKGPNKVQQYRAKRRKLLHLMRSA